MVRPQAAMRHQLLLSRESGSFDAIVLFVGMFLFAPCACSVCVNPAAVGQYDHDGLLTWLWVFVRLDFLSFCPLVFCVKSEKKIYIRIVELGNQRLSGVIRNFISILRLGMQRLSNQTIRCPLVRGGCWDRMCSCHTLYGFPFSAG